MSATYFCMACQHPMSDHCDDTRDCCQVGCKCKRGAAADAPAEMVRAWRDLDRRVMAEEITTTKAAELFIAEFVSGPSRQPAPLAQPTPPADTMTQTEPLRADATDEQIGERFIALLQDFYRRVPEAQANGALNVTIQVVREFATALRAKFDAQHDDIWMAGELSGAELRKRSAPLAQQGAGSTGAPSDQPTPEDIPLRPIALDVKRFDCAPCYLCGYNGAGYYQPDQHPCATRYHATVNGIAERRAYERCVTCEPIIDAILARWPAASRVPSESPIEVRAAVREALTKLARSAGRLSWGPFAVIKHIEEFRDREYPALSSESPPASSEEPK